MEVFQTDRFYIFVKREKSLWWNRTTSEFSLKAGWDLSSVDDIECLGVTHGIIGVISLPGLFEPHLVIIKEATPVGVLYPPYLVYKIKSICILSNDEADTILTACPRHNSSRINTTPTHSSKQRLLEGGSQLMNKTWGAVKIAGNTIKTTTQQAAALASNQVKSTVGVKDQTKIEKKIIDELHKIFDDTDSFYFCLESDITNNLQRRHVDNDENNFQYDKRFFWNYHMIKDIMEFNDKTWVLPIVQGFVQIEQCVIGSECFTLALVSRRSRYRAGTRYKRRGVDENGHCANYVETEQILSFRQHQMSFTQVRGSVPIFWSQPGYKYRPPPRLDRDENETQIAFEKHFNQELDIYKNIFIINLVEQSGKEKVIGDAYANHILKYNSDRLIYVTFDFHDYCRGMRFENVSTLVEALAPEIGAMGFHWRDKRGIICDQKAVFRVNCMDCLDRTNVVETAIAKAVLESQLVKLGLSPPYSPLPEPLKQSFMDVWANNGDIISRQYAGTNALKGDYTRTGERKLTGIMKDGMNSANRYIIQNFADSFRQSVIDLMQGNINEYTQINEDDVINTIFEIAQETLKPSSPAPIHGYYHAGVLGPELRLAEDLILNTSYYLARFKDSYRQATIDLMLGNQVTQESLNALGGPTAPDDNDALEGAEHARLLVEDCRRLLLGTSQFPVGAWGLIDADPRTGDFNETEVDSILLLTDNCYIVAEYDSHLDKIIRYEKVLLENITSIELGMFQQTKLFQGSIPAFLCLRINYVVDNADGYFHMFRSPNIRFFNNVAVVIKTPEEIMESFTAIVEFFRMALENIGKTDVQFISGGILQRRKSKTPHLDVPRGMPRNLSESQLVQVSSKALSNVAGQFSKFGQSLNPNKNKKSSTTKSNTSEIERATEAEEKVFFSVGPTKDHKTSASSSDSEDHENSIYEPTVKNYMTSTTTVAPSNVESTTDNIYNENTFLPSVGIVMASSENKGPVGHLEEKDNTHTKICSEDVLTMSISSVMDHVSLPAGLLESSVSIRPRSPNPEIRIEGSETKEYIKQTVSAQETRSSSPQDFTLNLTGSHSENALKQLKTLTSPLSKLAKGMQNLGMNLDPRKMASKSGTATPSQIHSADSSPPEKEKNKLQEIWDEHHCRTKLIAL